MIKTLRITSIIAAILAAGFIAFPMVFGFRSDEDIERFLNSPSIIDKYRQAGGEKLELNVDTSPLVAQAMKFASYINPAKPVPVARQPAVKEPIGTKPPPPEPEITTAKFKVVATSYHESRPDMSVALIDQPGAGRRWVREGTEVMHLTIQQIKEGVVVVKGGQGVFELAVPKVREVNLLDDGSPSADSATTTVPASIGASHALETVPDAPVDARRAGASGRITAGQKQVYDATEEERKLAEKIFAELEAMPMQGDPAAGGAGSQGKVSSRRGAPGAPRPGPEATRIGDEEAEKLANLGKELKGVKTPDRGRDRRRGLRDPRERINQRLEEQRKRIEALAERRMRKDQTPEDDASPDQ